MRGSRYITFARGTDDRRGPGRSPGPFIRAWFGPGFEASIRVARLLVLAQLFVPLYQIGDPMLIGKGRFCLWVPSGLLLALLNLVLSVIFVGLFGLVGVAFGTGARCFLELPLYAWLILREIGASRRASGSGPQGWATCSSRSRRCRCSSRR